MTFHVLHAQLNEYIKRVDLGQFLNRFSNDIDKVDLSLAVTFLELVYEWPLVILDIYIIVTGAESIYLLIPCTFYIFLGFHFRNKYMKAKREVFRLSAKTKSPIVGLAVSTFNGGSQIRALGCEEFMIEKCDDLIKKNSQNVFMTFSLDAWFYSVLTYTNYFFVLLPCYGMMVYTLYNSDPSKKKNSTKIAFFILQTSQFIFHFIESLRSTCDIESQLISIERCRNFELIEPEIGYKKLEEDKKIFEEPDNLKKCYKTIEERQKMKLVKNGSIEFKEVYAKYPTSSNYVISGISLKISAKEKIGIVGRTGAGKSSFVKLLWRGMESIKGEILIDDNLNLKTPDLKEYRENITWISQASNLFEGSIKKNISPKRKLKLEEILKITDLLKELNFPEEKIDPELSFKIESEGSNLSEGEKQILSLVRGVYDMNKIVILDEISAFVEKKIERKFNEVCEREFKDSTVFIIAHRLENVLTCDRIVVLGDGRIKEIGKVADLLDDPRSEFYQMWMLGDEAAGF